MRLDDGYRVDGTRGPVDDETLALVGQLMGCNPWRKKWTGWQGPPETATAALREALDAGMRVDFV